MGKAQQLETRNRGSMHLNPNSKCNKRRIRWTTELHQRFEQAVAALGGAACATPKGILERMKAPEVTIMHVKSHLQKYRLTLTSDGSGQHKYSGSDEHVSFQDRPSRCLGLGAHADVYGDEDEFGVARDNVRMELADVDNKLAEAADVQQPSALPDNAARKKLVDTVVQQHTMQEELKHQIRVCIAAVSYLE